MSLNIYLYRVHKIPKNILEEFEGKTQKEINDHYNKRISDILFISEKDIQETPALYKDLKPYLNPIMIKRRYTDFAKIKKDYNIPVGAGMYNQSHYPSGVVYEFMSCNQRYKVDIKKDILKEKYDVEKLDKMFVAYIDEVYNWRNDYRVMDLFHDYIPSIRNLGYYKVTKEIFSVLKKRDEKTFLVYFRDNTREGIFYQESFD